jgi:enoyl-CoA hydratase/carnithine racemase
MDNRLVTYDQDGGVAVLTLNNPGRHNALSTEVMETLKDYLRRFEQDSAVRVVVLRSQGPVFSSGHDLNEMIGRPKFML